MKELINMDKRGAVSDYLDGLSEQEKAVLLNIITRVKELVPSAVEGESYGLPAFRYKKRPLIGFSANKGYLSLYPFSPAVVDEVKHELQDYKLSKGTIRFTADRPVPGHVIDQMILLRAREIDQAG